ncbi:MAG TPA: cysteine hydrolase family protein [Hypericibacter adhaerens]|uniref:Isochorismatase n=1 Tax=Hypericibacter adhaerens TaxID=2602016 RepID=A0A5J6MY97_9PROT|nr:cysteine hydrolase family protein [Hypericibacter adhaerens]QEX22732.1 isochorismatase [Hypericibacter adhaerens]HWA42098.1 cysteine hydrolase family protein [Hypericibacter adhaerens]
MTTALVVIDVQNGMFESDPPPYRGDVVLSRIAGLLDRARAAGTPVFHVQHDGGPGDPLAKGTPGFDHHPMVAPRGGEPVIEKRRVNAFQDTDFHARLQQAGIDRLIIAGLQTEYCVDTACRVAVGLGYKVALVADAHSTFDSTELPAERIVAHHNNTLGGGFVELVTSDKVAFQAAR